MLGLNVVLEHSAAPHRVINFVLGGADGISPDLVHRRIALVEKRPLAGARIEAACTGGGCGPNEISLYANSVNDVIAQARIQLGEVVDAASGNAAQPAHRADPQVAGALVERKRQYGLMGQTIGWTKNFPFAVFVEAESVLRARPNAVSLHQHAKDAVIRQAVRNGEVLPAEMWHFLGSRQQNEHRKGKDRNESRKMHAQLAFHNVFKYSMRSFSSSFVRSLLTPCISFGLNTVQISSSERAEPSCRYGAE